MATQRVGIIRNHSEKWTIRLYKFIEESRCWNHSYGRAYIGMLKAWDLGFTQLEVEIDSLDAIRLIKSKTVRQGTPSVMLHIRVLEKKECNVQFQHVPRDGNQTADKLIEVAIFRSRGVLSPHTTTRREKTAP
ncbi:uncharacterized protein LOC120117210 [Hibiscus syriacus]|uniref:uncharacterized protein LOC120117210 n=1 Tax=Hibiscus syriacus TaxID=106335 RepID=UPI0019217E85|nr:uncharacterized protein LOC120117210 [Hibiscus syriacus]